MSWECGVRVCCGWQDQKMNDYFDPKLTQLKDTFIPVEEEDAGKKKWVFSVLNFMNYLVLAFIVRVFIGRLVCYDLIPKDLQQALSDHKPTPVFWKSNRLLVEVDDLPLLIGEADSTWKSKWSRNALRNGHGMHDGMVSFYATPSDLGAEDKATCKEYIVKRTCLHLSMHFIVAFKLKLVCYAHYCVVILFSGDRSILEYVYLRNHSHWLIYNKMYLPPLHSNSCSLGISIASKERKGKKKFLKEQSKPLFPLYSCRSVSSEFDANSRPTMVKPVGDSAEFWPAGLLFVVPTSVPVCLVAAPGPVAFSPDRAPLPGCCTLLIAPRGEPASISSVLNNRQNEGRDWKTRLGGHTTRWTHRSTDAWFICNMIHL